MHDARRAGDLMVMTYAAQGGVRLRIAGRYGKDDVMSVPQHSTCQHCPEISRGAALIAENKDFHCDKASFRESCAPRNGFIHVGMQDRRRKQPLSAQGRERRDGGALPVLSSL